MALETTYRRSVEFWKFTVQEVSGDWARRRPVPTGPYARWSTMSSEKIAGPSLVDGRTIADVGDALMVICWAKIPNP
jgi:hypothetical protein